MMSLNINNLRFYWVVLLLLKKRLNIFDGKVMCTYLCAGILNDISAISVAIDIFEKYTNTNE